MLRIALPNPIRPYNRRWLASGCIALYLVACSGLSLPMPAPDRTEKDDSTPYPCQNGTCGCDSAEKCWNNCCCLTMAERLAWARAHHVTPPDFVVAQAAADSAQEESACCAGCCEETCTSNTAADALVHDHSCEDACCLPATCGQASQRGSSAASCCHTPPAKTKPAATKAIHWVNFIEAQKCSGQMLDWLAVGATTPPTAAMCVEFDATVQWLPPASLPGVLSVVDLPEVPPPRPALV